MGRVGGETRHRLGTDSALADGASPILDRADPAWGGSPKSREREATLDSAITGGLAY